MDPQLQSTKDNSYITMTERNIDTLDKMSKQFTIEWKFNKFYPNPKAMSVGYNFIVRFKHEILGMIRCEVFSTGTEFRPTMTIDEMSLTFNNMVFRPTNLALELQTLVQTFEDID